jgi:hypothetical protein
MKIRITLLVTIVVTAVLLFFLLPAQKQQTSSPHGEEEEENEAPAAFIEARMKYEYDMLKDPRTGKIPEGIFEQEKAFARTLPVRSYGDVAATGVNGTNRTEVLNTYIPAGPNNIGGRTRAVEYDLRYATTKVIIAGCVSGGIMRSADGGNTWTLVTPQNEIHNLTALAQDPRPGFQDTWYAGGGEPYGNTAGEIGATFMGYGVWKSTNNGVSWTRQTLTVTDINGTVITGGTLEAFDHPFDFVHRIRINPVNGDVYIAAHRRLIRSSDGGTSFQTVFAGTQGAIASGGQMDVAITGTGKVFLAVNGGFPEQTLRGVWVSPSGNQNTFTRIAGGQTLGTDSVAGWRANSYTILSGSTTPEPKRILLTLAPSNNNIAYVFYENGLSSDAVASGGNLKPEADLYRLDINGSTYTWSNRSANMPDIAGGNLSGSDPLTVQGGYDMEVTVKPDNPNVVFVGGTNLYRSTDGFATTSNTAWIGGYVTNFQYSQYANSHADIHRLVFSPASTTQAICANDGGIQETTDIMATASAAAPVTWRVLPNYQTLQCYNVAIDPGTGRNNFASGSQDNGVRFRDKTGVLGTAPADSNNHRLLFSADGAYVGISLDNNGTQYLYESIQLGRLYRARLASNFTGGTEITPTGLTTSSTDAGEDQFGEFVTNLRLESDNSNNLYYVNFNRLFRTTTASTVTSSSWTELTGVSAAVDPTDPTGGRNVGIRGMGFSRGPYTSSHVLYLGTTNGKIFRLDDPQNVAATARPVNITPTGLSGNVQDIAVNPNNDDEVIAVVSNYGVTGIWWTKNGKSASPTWKNAEGNLTLPSFRSCAIVVKKDAANQPVTEYYVGTSIGLYSTSNLGTVLDANQTPQWQREGGSLLNFAVITSLAYRPVDNVLLVGTHGNGMFYTFLGTPNYTPNLNTSVPPVTNDRSFIRTVYPTAFVSDVQYQTGDMTGIRKITVQVLNMKGQVVFQETRGYQSGSVPLQRLSSGMYILNILSDDNKYRHVQKILRQ